MAEKNDQLVASVNILATIDLNLISQKSKRIDRTQTCIGVR